jgi:hypothetical protein
MHGGWLIIPRALRERVLQDLQVAHMGMTKTMGRLSTSVWWPGINTDIKAKTEGCPMCRARLPSERVEPLQPLRDVDHLYQRLHADLFQASGVNYLAIVDEFSRWPSLIQLGDITAAAAAVI